MAGIALTTALTAALGIAGKAAGGFQAGGYTGGGGVSDIAGFVHGQEFVFDAGATSRIGVQNLEALRSGNGFKSGGYTGKGKGPVSIGGGSGGEMRVVIEDHGTGATFEVKSVTHEEVRLIARSEAQSALGQVPELVAGELARPNSKVSKALVSTTTTRHRKGG